MALGLAGCNKASDNKAAGTEGSQPAAATTGEKRSIKLKIRKSYWVTVIPPIPFSYIAGTPNQPVMGYLHLQLKLLTQSKTIEYARP